MREVSIIGVGMTRFTKWLERSMPDLGHEAVWKAMQDANMGVKDIQVAYSGNTLGAQLTDIKGEVGQRVLTEAGFYKIPIINVQNACSTGSTALRGAYLEVASGNFDVALAIGTEKLFCGDTSKSIGAMADGTALAQFGFMFVGLYSMQLRGWMERTGVTKADFAKVTVKNMYNGSLNPYAQFQKPVTVEEVLGSRVVAEPLHLFMCCTMGDGSAAVIVCAKEIARRFTSKPLIDIAACELISGSYTFPGEEHEPISTRAAKRAYEKAGIGPEDVQVAEVHDAMAPAELKIYEEIGFCMPGESGRMIDEGVTALTGRLPVNPSGGLAAKGHPIAATGLAQIAELVWQMRGEAGTRQVTNNPKVGLTENAGGWVADDNAACGVTILKR
jgi:acetyl-CoA acetyltransferase